MKALDGRPIGKRGAETRRRLLDATAVMLETHGVRDLRVVEIAREVGASPATFYQYFRDVEEAVLECSAEIGSEIAPLASLLDQQWTDVNGLEAARQLVEGFLDHWDAHRAVLRTRNLAAQEGDPRFREVRNAANAPFLDGFARQVVDPDLAPLAASAALVALLERMAAFHTELEPMGIPRTDLVETTARIVYKTVVGR
ncbi:MAG TPA: TetR family transcriptional regulator [Acidimicrobiia bacterium]|nr:TetR family transcriptional regulator [Acidimicrobiia bacterium]